MRLLLQTQGIQGAEEIDCVLSDAAAEIEEMGWGCYKPRHLIERAAFARLRGDEAERTGHLREAHRLFTEMGATWRAEQLAREIDS